MPSPYKETFNKAERLCSKKAIEGLFENGYSLFCYPLQVIWSESNSPDSFPAQIAFSVPKRVFKDAVNRNLVRRRMKEAYRRNKYILYNSLHNKQIRIILIMIYKTDRILDYRKIEMSVLEVLKELAKE